MLRGVRTALRDNSPVEVDRWLQLKDLWKLGDDDFTMAFARLYAALELRPARVGADDLRVLASRAMTAEQRGQAAWLQVIHDARVGDRAAAVARGQADADRLAGPFPALAANILREVALARLEDDDVEGAVRDCRQALALAQDAVWRETADDPTEAAPLLERPRPGVPPPVRLTQTEVNAATTLSASLLWGGRTREGVDFCAEMASRCGEARLARGQGAFLSNLAAGQLFLGQRDESTHSLALCREIQSLHGDPVVLAWCATFQARLAIERGDLSAGRQFLDEAITAGQALSNGRLLAEAWSLVLEAAVQSADAAEAQRALATYGSGGIQSTADHWPAVLGRWRWMVGDLEGALAAVSEPRLGYNGLCVEAERCRLLLVGGDNDAAWRAGNALARRASESEMDELALFARLVAGAAIGAPDAEYTDLVDRTRRSRWVHLYLGALHLDAIRRQLRGENVGVVLRQLRSRALDLNHKLYAALAREEGW